MTVRPNNWQSDFADLIAARAAAPFVWGAQDCVLFGADCMRACTGRDPARDYRGSYSDERGAARLLNELGGVEGVAENFAGPEIRPTQAQPGDVGTVMSGGRLCIAVSIGWWWVAPGESGLLYFPTEEVVRAWRAAAEET